MRLIRARRSRERVVGFGMNRIVKEHYPVERLPEELREGLDPQARARVSIEVDMQPQGKLRDILKNIQERQSRGDWNIATDDPVERIRKLRDEWDD